MDGNWSTCVHLPFCVDAITLIPKVPTYLNLSIDVQDMATVFLCRTAVTCSWQSPITLFAITVLRHGDYCVLRKGVKEVFNLTMPLLFGWLCILCICASVGGLIVS